MKEVGAALFGRKADDEQVIDGSENEVEFTKDHIDETLKSLRNFAEAKWSAKIFKQDEMSDDSSFMKIVQVDRDVIEDLHQIQLREYLSTGQTGSEVMQVWFL